MGAIYSHGFHGSSLGAKASPDFRVNDDVRHLEAAEPLLLRPHESHGHLTVSKSFASIPYLEAQYRDTNRLRLR